LGNPYEKKKIMDEINGARNITKGTLEADGEHKKYTQSAEFFSRLQVRVRCGALSVSAC
jgi:hypothetical protein